jgi:outer membrane lipoprotein carrier protein
MSSENLPSPQREGIHPVRWIGKFAPSRLKKDLSNRVKGRGDQTISNLSTPTLALPHRRGKRLMGKFQMFLVSISFILSNLLFIPMSFSATGREVLLEIQSRYENTNDFEANFLQEYIDKVMKKPQKGEGKVYFKKKGMMRWDYRVPNQKLISNGQVLWFYQPEENQVYVSDISRVIREKTPLAFLAGEGNLSRDFNLLNFNESVSQKEDNYILELTPKEPYAALSKLGLTVDKKTFFVLQADVFDGLGNVTRTRFLDIKTNTNLPDSLFQFTIPSGAEVLKMQEPAAPRSGGKGPPTK